MDLFCIVLAYWIKSSRSSKQIHLFSSYLIRFFVPLASPKVLSLGNKKKSELSFCISLTYSYLCHSLAKYQYQT